MQNFIVKKFPPYDFVISRWLFRFSLPVSLMQLAEIKMENVFIINHAMELYLKTQLPPARLSAPPGEDATR